MIIFEKIRYKNFLSFGNIFTEIDLSKSSTTLIVGANGQGKSVLLDALTFSLFGKPFRHINKPQLVNSITNKDCVVEIEFKIGKQQYKIIRGIKPNIFEVYKNGKMINQSSESKEYQYIVETQILKINYKTFCQVVILGSASYVPFMQLSTSQRREIIEDLLDLEIFTTMNSILKDKVIINNEKIIEMQGEQKLVKGKIELIKKHIEEIQNNIEKIINEKNQTIIEINNQIDYCTTLFYDVNKKILNKQQSMPDTIKLLTKLKKLDSLHHKISAKKDLISNDLNFFKTHKDCPTCTQVIDNIFRENILDKKEIELTEITSGLKKLSEEKTELQNNIDVCEKIKIEISELTMEQYKIKNDIDSSIKYRTQIEKELIRLKTQQEDHNISTIKILEEQMVSVDKQVSELQEEKQILTVCSTLLKDSGIKAKIIKQYVPIFNKLINKYLSSLDFFVQFNLDENFNETIKSRYRDEFSYGSFSEGEKMRINLAVLFTWRAIAKMRNSINTNLLVMDETLDASVDQFGVDNIFNLINDLKDTNIFVISHRSQSMDKFTNILQFVKHKNFSKIST